MLNATNLDLFLEGQFTAVQQAIGLNKGKEAAHTWLKAFVEASKADGLVASLIAKFGVEGRLSDLTEANSPEYHRIRGQKPPAHPKIPKNPLFPTSQWGHSPAWPGPRPRGALEAKIMTHNHSYVPFESSWR